LKKNNKIKYENEQVEKTIGNEYEIQDNKAILKLKKRDGSFIDTQIDKIDLEKVLNKGTWSPEWSRDYNNYIVQNVSFCDSDGKKLKKKIALHSFVIDADIKTPIRHIDGDSLNNCRSNLTIYSQDTKNDFENIDEDTVSIILRDKNGIKKARTLIDQDDLERVVNSGLTWCYYKYNNAPYAVANTVEGRIFLHRFILNTDAEEDAVMNLNNHDTLDNRKKELSKFKFEPKPTE
jgi:hypothetical protein